jgi:ABC-type transport system substrate-binding protein
MSPNPAEGKKLIDAAGAGGLEINANYYQYLPYNTRIADLLVDEFRAVGVNLKNQLTDYTEFNSQWIGASFADATTSGWGTVGYDADNFFYNQIHSKSPGNRWRIKDAQTDQWAEEQQVELDPEKRREIHRKIWDLHMQKMFRLFEPVGYGFNPLQAYVRGIRGGNVGNSISYDDGPMVAAGAWLDK